MTYDGVDTAWRIAADNAKILRENGSVYHNKDKGAFLNGNQ